MSSRTVRYFLRIFIPLAGLALLGGAFLKIKADEVTMTRLQARQQQALRHGMDVLRSDLATAYRDLILIAQNDHLRQSLQEEHGPSLQALTRDLRVLANVTPLYEQIRWIDERGLERLRLERQAGRVIAVATDQLQDKSSRYYFREAMALKPGQLYVSSLDLNIERQFIERPNNPTLRLAMPIADLKGQRRGILLLNYQAGSMLNRFSQATDDLACQGMLLTQDGHWLAGQNTLQESGHSFDTLVPLSRSHPLIWQQVQSSESGQRFTPSGLWTWQTLSPQQAVAVPHRLYPSRDPAGWKIMAWVSPAELAALKQPSLERYLLGCGVLLLVLAMISWRLARTQQSQDRAQEQLVRSELRYRTLFEFTINPILLFGPSGLIDCNPATLRIFGASSKSEILGRQMGDLSARRQPDGQESTTAIARHIAQAQRGENAPFEWTCRRFDTGSLFFMTLRLTPLTLDEQPLLLASARDITDRVQAQSQIRSALQRLTLATDAANIGIWCWNFADNSLEWDERLCDWYEVPEGQRRSGLYLDYWHSRLHPADADRAQAVLFAALENDEPYVDEFRLLRSDGTIRHIQTRSILDYDADGLPIRMVGINSDVTTQREQEARLRAAKQAADAASRAKSQFLAAMSHEIRTPLNSVLGLTQLLLEERPSPRQAEYLGKIKSAASALLGILNDILDYATLESGGLSLECRPFAVSRLLENSRALFAFAAEEKQLSLNFILDAGVPPMLYGDPLHLQQVLNNLLSNALKFTERGSVELKISSIPLEDGRVQLCLCVQDSGSGIGISAAQQAQLFRPFQQADFSTTRKYGGTGLGLSICQQLARLMGGEIQLESQPGRGSRFYFHVPLPVAPAEQASREPTVAPIIDSMDPMAPMAPVAPIAPEAMLLNEMTQDDQPFSLPGLALERSAAQLGPGGWDVLRHLLLSFYEDFVRTPAQLEAALAQQDYATAARLVHTIKGLAPTLGADSLYELAVPFNQQLKEQRSDLLADFQHQLRQVLAAIEPLTRQETAPIRSTESLRPLDGEALQPQLAALAKMLATGQSKARKLSREIELLLLDTQLQEPYAAVAKAIGRLDFETAHRLLQQLMTDQGWKL